MTDWEQDILKELKKREYFWGDQDFIIDLIKSEIKNAFSEYFHNDNAQWGVQGKFGDVRKYQLLYRNGVNYLTLKKRKNRHDYM